MTYVKILWTHSFEDEPVEMLSELDEQRRELRKVEHFRSGVLRFAGPDGSSGGTCLSETPIPSLAEIARDPQFQTFSIERDEFERAWQAATYAAAA